MNAIVGNPLLPWAVMMSIIALATAECWRRAERRAVVIEKRLRSELDVERNRLVASMMEDAEARAKLFERLIATQKTDTTALIESVVRLATTGTTAQPTALAEPPVLTANEVLSRQVTEDTIRTGMVRMREVYEMSGTSVPPDDELREEVELLLAGVLPESATAGLPRSFSRS